MSDSIYYEFGQIDGKTPLEVFYEAMLPHLKNYGLTAEFPADKPSLVQTVSDIKFSVWIGESPAAIRYIKWQESPYGMGGFEVTLESDTLVHTETGEKLSLKIFMTDYISGMTHAAGTLWLSIKFSGAEGEVARFKDAVTEILANYRFHSQAVQNSPDLSDKSNNFSADVLDDSENFSRDPVAKNNVLTAASLQLWIPANKERLAYWFDVSDNVRSSNELFTDYAYQIPEMNFAANGLDLKRGFHEKNLNWNSFCWYFYRHVCNLIFAGEHKPMMREIFSELAGFSSLVSGNIAGRYAVLLHDFLVDFKLPANIAALLPEKILAKMPELEESFKLWMEAEVEREQEMIRQGMMGY